ncbi:MAG: hypothetical protein D5R97_05160, partial [Candidatus Syntrophonatronum acetioxidans]
MGLSEYKDIFLSEANEYIKTLNNSLLEIEKGSEDPDLLKEMVDSVNRIKVMADTMGFEQIASLTHQMENLFNEIRRKTIKGEKRVINLLFESLDILEKLLNQVEAGEEEEDVSDLAEKLEKITAAESREEMEKEELPAGAIKEERDKEEEEIKKARERGEQVFLVTVKV